MCNEYELLTFVKKDGHVNNYVQVVDDDTESLGANLRKRLTGEDPHLTKDERLNLFNKKKP
jgi:hypothetical protein